MSKVVDCFHIQQYTVLKLDEMPVDLYSKYIIEGQIFEPVPIYDMPQCIAIVSDDDFIGKTVGFA